MPPPPPPAAGSSRGRCLSFAAARDRCFSHRFLRAGMRPLAIPLPAPAPAVPGAADPDPAATTHATTVHMWAPSRPPRNPLLLLHGFGASATWQWAPYLRPLIAAGFDPIVPDLVFFGGSCTRLPDRSDAFQAATIKAAMDAIGVTRFGLVGVSYGGFVGYRMAAMFPEAVERVAMICAGVCLEEKDLAEGLFPVAGVGEAAALLVPRRPEEVRRLVRLTFVRPPIIMPSCFLWDYIKVMGSDHIQEKTELLYALISGRHLSTLPKLTQPALIIWGEQDRVFPMELAHRLNRHVEGNSRLVVIKNAGHAVNLEKPKEVCKNIIEFFKEPVAEAVEAANGDDKVWKVCISNHETEPCQSGEFQDWLVLDYYSIPKEVAHHFRNTNVHSTQTNTDPEGIASVLHQLVAGEGTGLHLGICVGTQTRTGVNVMYTVLYLSPSLSVVPDSLQLHVTEKKGKPSASEICVIAVLASHACVASIKLLAF